MKNSVQSTARQVETQVRSPMISPAETTMSYFVVGISYPRSFNQLTGIWTPACIEAIVNPEITQREVVSRIHSNEYERDRIAFIHHITMNDVPRDVTEELIGLASNLDSDDFMTRSKARMEINRWDHARDLRKHATAD